jgi:dihydroneopterin aldolase
VDRCRGAGLLVGLAGSLAREDIPPLLQIDPDYLGFRGALCRNGERRQQLDASAFMLIREAIPETAPRRRPGVAA